jgi:hypothetical protein
MSNEEWPFKKLDILKSLLGVGYSVKSNGEPEFRQEDPDADCDFDPDSDTDPDGFSVRDE